METKIKIYNIKELEEHCKKLDKEKNKRIKEAKKLVIMSWDKGRDGRKFVEKNVTIEHHNIKMFMLENGRGLVLNWHGCVLGIDNWGKLIFYENGN